MNIAAPIPTFSALEGGLVGVGDAEAAWALLELALAARTEEDEAGADVDEAESSSSEADEEEPVAAAPPTVLGSMVLVGSVELPSYSDRKYIPPTISPRLFSDTKFM